MGVGVRRWGVKQKARGRWSRQQCVVGLSAVSGAEEPTCASPAAWPDGPLAPRTWRGKASADRVPSAGRASQKQCEGGATGGKERQARRGAAKTALVRVLLCRHTRASQPSGLATRMVPYAPGEGWQGRRAWWPGQG